MGAVEAYHIEGIEAWDVAAGKLIIEEAGGIVIDTAGRHCILSFARDSIIITSVYFYTSLITVLDVNRFI